MLVESSLEIAEVEEPGSSPHTIYIYFRILVLFL